MNTCIRAKWYVSNPRCDIHQWFRCIYSPFIITYIKHSSGTFYQIPVPSQVCFYLHKLQSEAAAFSPAPESTSAVTLPQPVIWHAGDVNSDLLQITGGLLRGHTSKKKQSVITWLQIFMLHLRRDRDWKHLCKLIWNILLSFQGGGGDFISPPSGCSCMAYWKLLGYWHILARKINFIVVKGCVFNKLMWLKTQWHGMRWNRDVEMWGKRAQKPLLGEVVAELRTPIKTFDHRFCPSQRHFPALWVRGCWHQGIQQSSFGFFLVGCFSFFPFCLLSLF